MRKSLIAGAALAASIAGGVALYKSRHRKTSDDDFDITRYHWDDPSEITELDRRIYELAKRYTPAAAKLLTDLIRIPADHISNDPLCGTSNHEGPRLEFLKKQIIELKAVRNPKDVDFDEFGSLIWTVTDNRTPRNELRVVYLDGHSDTVAPLRESWHKRLGDGIDPFEGLTDPDSVDEAQLKRELRYIPPKERWGTLLFGRGSADQLQGIVAQVFATKIMLELEDLGALKGVKIISIATVAEEDNDGGASMKIMRKPRMEPDEVPDCVVITEGTGDLELGPCGIYIGQRGRCQVEVEVVGRSCHGAMPNMGINPLEFSALIIAEAAEQAKSAFGDSKFLGKGTRTCSKCFVDTPSDCAVPARCVFRFDRRLTKGENARMACLEIESLKSVHQAREAGCDVTVRIPTYREKSYRGVPADNEQDYMGWVTKPDDPVVRAAVESYKRTVTPHVEEPPHPGPDDLRKQPRVQRWIFSTDGVGYPMRIGENKFSIEGKNWIEAGEYVHPSMFGIGAGYEHHCHKLGEYVHKDHLWCPIAVIARFPSLFVKHRNT